MGSWPEDLARLLLLLLLLRLTPPSMRLQAKPEACVPKSMPTSQEEWGTPAWERWSSMSPEERQTGRYHYLENFKLHLRSKGHQGGDQDQGQGQQAQGPAGGGGSVPGVVSPLPPGLIIEQVVADYLRAMKGYIYKRLSEARINAGAHPPDTSSVGWVLTVPAMWDQAAKAKLRKAASRAGMVLPTDPTSLALALEPEAAAVAFVVVAQLKEQQLQALRSKTAAASTDSTVSAPNTAAAAAVPDAEDGPVHVVLEQVEAAEGARGGPAGASAAAVSGSRAAAVTLRDGDVVLVLDCGGGTVDMAMHQVLGEGPGLRLEEAAVGHGLEAGGVFVDERVWAVVRRMVGSDPWDCWKAANPTEWTQLAQRWELAKRGTWPVRLQLPQTLVDTVRAYDKVRRPMDLLINDGLLPRRTRSPGSAAASDGRSSIDSENMLELSVTVLEREVFGPVVDQIVEAAKKVLEEGDDGGNPCTKLLLVGGLAESKYLQRRIRQLAAERALPLLKTRSPASTVVFGAALFGHQAARVTSRRCRLTYGIACRAQWTEADARSYSQCGYPRKLWKAEDQTYYSEDVFEQFVHRGQRVGNEEVVRRTFCPTAITSSSTALELYSSPASSARYTVEPGMRRVATMTLELPPDWHTRVPSRQDYKVEVELRFGGPEITLVARDPQTNNKVATTVDWRPEPVGEGC